jgi:hypothetical protein
MAKKQDGRGCNQLFNRSHYLIHTDWNHSRHKFVRTAYLLSELNTYQWLTASELLQIKKTVFGSVVLLNPNIPIVSSFL